jgi:hypothetical protein
MKKYSASEYLRTVFNDDLAAMCKAGFPFYAYGILCQGLELLGGLFDTKNKFDAKGLSEDRFSRGVKEIYSNKKYNKCKKGLFEQLRGSLIHQLRQAKGFREVVYTAQYCRCLRIFNRSRFRNCAHACNRRCSRGPNDFRYRLPDTRRGCVFLHPMESALRLLRAI